MYHEKNVMFADSALTSEGWNSPIFIPDVLTPSQHLDTLRARHLDPERSLMLAVLEEGINDYCNTKPHSKPDLRSNKAKKLHEDTRLWILGAGAYVTFRDCCEALGITPEWLRKGVLTSPATGKLKRRHVVTKPKTINLPLAKTIEMHREGATIDEIASAIGISRRTIFR